ncbi:UDP-N-acetylmuramoyl-tripeptide--D-alanyl-D-alanine ligase, partial [candidate division KSB1 bacterium]|nr:UDP-N-acetylmuramoyl-tripeptide--D-alanyl-D-alanine ligase [candidate division KSB1 bacterium]
MGPAADLDRPVTKVATDSRTIASGDVFFALAGERYDGHDFALQVLQAGAV